MILPLQILWMGQAPIVQWIRLRFRSGALGSNPEYTLDLYSLFFIILIAAVFVITL